MGTFSTYSMAGIGIAAAIGFISALTVLSNSAVNPELADDNQLEDSLPSPSSSSSSQQKREAGEEEEDQSAQLMMEQDANNNNNLRPTLASIVVLDANTGEVIGELGSEMQFKVNEQVLIQANFVSQDKVTDHLITLAIRSNTAEEAGEDATTDDNNNNNSDSDDSSSQMTSLLEKQQQQAVNLRGDIGPDSNIKIELYWSPSNVGEYTLTLYSTTPEERGASAQSSAVVIVEPIVEVSLRVV